MSDREESTGYPSQAEYKTRSGRISKPSAKLHPKQKPSHYSQDQTENLGDQKPPAQPPRDDSKQQVFGSSQEFGKQYNVFASSLPFCP